jgi:sugar lactone lactonase YvrE
MSRFEATVALLSLLLLFGGQTGAAEPELFVSSRLTPTGVMFSKHIEGPSVDAAGVLYVPNFLRDGTIGTLRPGASLPKVLLTLPSGSVGNGSRFDKQGRMFIADYKRHNVFALERGKREVSVYFTSREFNQPNDLAIADDGTLYLSDPNFSPGRNPRPSQIWRIERGPDGRGRGEPMRTFRVLGTVNGIDLSPDGSSLYVSESSSRQVWSYDIGGGTLASPRLLKTFEDDPSSELDGLRTDATGKIYVTRPGSGKVAVLAPDGSLVREIAVKGKDPTNIAFGGSDGSTAFITQADGRFVETFRVDSPGREFCQIHSSPSCKK